MFGNNSNFKGFYKTIDDAVKHEANVGKIKMLSGGNEVSFMWRLFGDVIEINNGEWTEASEKDIHHPFKRGVMGQAINWSGIAFEESQGA